uniref:Protein Nef n=1 Tax=Simian immunodeficiency virus TaxID=11723 RepID=B2ZC47_SIV|nr:Nef protein [Simian immunodeficiency virus]
MGGVISKKQPKPRGDLRERLLRARGNAYGRILEGSEGASGQSQDASGRVLSSRSCEPEPQAYCEGQFMNTPWKNPATERAKLQYRQQCMDDIESDEEDEIGVSVHPRVPLRAMTYKLAIDMSHFIKEKGGLEGIYYSERGHKILDLYLEKEEGIIPDWQNYTKGPGIRYPTQFGWLWKLVPVDVSDEVQNDEAHYLVHPAVTSQWDDPWGETLAWKFDPTLAYSYEAFVRHPEEFGWNSGLSKEEVKKRLTARGLLKMAGQGGNS